MLPVFRKALYDSRKTVIWLAIGLALYMAFIMSFFPTIVDQSQEFDDLIKSYPKGMISMFYSGDIENFSISDPANFVQTYFASWTVLILGATAIVQGFNAFTNAERDGLMDVMLSLPVSRRAVLLGRLANTAVMILVVIAACFVVFGVGTVVVKEFDIGLGRLALGMFSAFWIVFAIACFTYMLATLVPSSKRFAGPVAYLFMMGSYLLYGFSGSVEALKDVRPLLIFHYYNMADIVRHGVDVGALAVLVGLSIVFAGVAWWAVDRKEMAV